MDKLIEKLEIKVAFLEDALGELSDEHYKQQKELDVLKTQYALLTERMKQQSGGDDSIHSSEDERPPHY